MTRDELLLVYQAELPRMRALVRQRLGSASPDVDDVLQDAFLQAWLHCETLRDDRSCASWLMRIAANTCVTYLRQSKRRVLCDDAEMLATETEDLCMRVVTRLTLEEAMARLSPAAKQMVWLHDWQGYPLKEVAHRMHKPESTVRSSLFRARTIMRNTQCEGCKTVMVV